MGRAFFSRFPFLNALSQRHFTISHHIRHTFLQAFFFLVTDQKFLYKLFSNMVSLEDLYE